MPLPPVPVILTIAGFDPSSGAGITGDLKTIAGHGFYGMACITALTVQNTLGVGRIQPVEPQFLKETLESLASDTDFAAVKIGMLGSVGAVGEVIRFVQSRKSIPIVLDPVLASSSGASLLDAEGTELLKKGLLPLATVITPNMAEAAALTRLPVKSLPEMRAAVRRLQEIGARNVVITGGHLGENTDLLRLESGEEREFTGAKIDSKSTHGTGCAFSTSLACRLAKGGILSEAIAGAKEYVRIAIEKAYPVGKGIGPLNHLFRLKS